MFTINIKWMVGKPYQLFYSVKWTLLILFSIGMFLGAAIMWGSLHGMLLDMTHFQGGIIQSFVLNWVRFWMCMTGIATMGWILAPNLPSLHTVIVYSFFPISGVFLYLCILAAGFDLFILVGTLIYTLSVDHWFIHALVVGIIRTLASSFFCLGLGCIEIPIRVLYQVSLTANETERDDVESCTNETMRGSMQKIEPPSS